MNKKAFFAFTVLVFASLLTSCAHFSGDIEKRYSSARQGSAPLEKSISIRMSGYANLSSNSKVQEKMNLAVESAFSKRQIEIDWIQEDETLPEHYLDIVMIVDNSSDNENRSVDPLSFLTAILSGLTVFILPLKSSDFDVIVKVNRYEKSQLIATDTYSSTMFHMAGISMLPLAGYQDIGYSMAKIIGKVSDTYLKDHAHAI